MFTVTFYKYIWYTHLSSCYPTYFIKSEGWRQYMKIFDKYHTLCIFIGDNYTADF